MRNGFARSGDHLVLSNHKTYKLCNTLPLMDFVTKTQLKYVGHLMKSSPSFLPKIMLVSTPESKKSRCKTIWHGLQRNTGADKDRITKHYFASHCLTKVTIV